MVRRTADDEGRGSTSCLTSSAPRTFRMTLRPTTTRAVPPRPASAASPLNAVTTPGGSWRRSTAREVPINELQEKFGWKDDSWQVGLMQAADAAGSKTRGGNGQVSAAELERYLAAPEDGQYLTSTALQQKRSSLDAKLAQGNGSSVGVDAFESGWQATVARRADLLGGNGDGQLSAEELDAFIQASKAGKHADTRWVPDQQMAAFQSRVAEAAGELDPLRPAGAMGSEGLSLVKEYSRLALDQGANVPTFVSYMLSASDIQETPATVSRLESTFVRDPELGRNGVTDSDYTRTGFDRGHMKPAEDSPTQEAMNESHLMTNIAPQHGNHNQQVWRTLEQGVSGLVNSLGGKAYILTGNLYLDDKGQPLPPEKRETTGAGERRLAVPTHNFKTVLHELPNGSLTMYAYLVPNTKDGPSKKEDILPLLDSHRVPVDRIEELLGQDLYANLPQRVQDKLEKGTPAEGVFQRNSLYFAASLFRFAPGN
ncbi:DNA/RNA non-specific endonuclease [Myxococcus xanthus]|uniref:DNA/RNA non-specific endonuclease n=1 Tax=Myxococcus xanthus TaxID=34 RepID=UPI0019175327|nr:DNA/RNA non-specific endonuclease [Myxococcus xanthus]QQR42980.1 DNA/RNA non-specific endonuclease [Myxococcus xanthus]